MALLLSQVFYRFIPNVWVIFAIVLWEGLLGGGAYVNTFYKMSKEVSMKSSLVLRIVLSVLHVGRGKNRFPDKTKILLDKTDVVQ